MTESVIEREYFEWMSNVVGDDASLYDYSYRKLLTFLHHTEFKARIRRDASRTKDGICLRHRFAEEYHDAGYDDIDVYLTGPCSVLEMLLALAFRCEDIMNDPALGDRTAQWFWKMIINMGLGPMTDGMFDKDIASDIVNTFIKRNYRYDGRGGLFTIKNPPRDLRQVEIWTQMMWYLDSMI